MNALNAGFKKIINDAGVRLGDMIAAAEAKGLSEKQKEILDPLGIGASGSKGLQRYFEWVGAKNVVVFASLYCRTLPKELNIDVANTFEVQVNEARRYLEERLLVDLEAEEIEPRKISAPAKR